MGRVKRKVDSNIRKMHTFRSSCASAKYHPDICSPFIIQIILRIRKLFITGILLADREGPDQTARMRSLIRAFAVRICPKTLSHGLSHISLVELSKHRVVLPALQTLCVKCAFLCIQIHSAPSKFLISYAYVSVRYSARIWHGAYYQIHVITQMWIWSRGGLL